MLVVSKHCASVSTPLSARRTPASLQSSMLSTLVAHPLEHIDRDLHAPLFAGRLRHALCGRRARQERQEHHLAQPYGRVFRRVRMVSVINSSCSSSCGVAREHSKCTAPHNVRQQATRPAGDGYFCPLGADAPHSRLNPATQVPDRLGVCFWRGRPLHRRQVLRHGELPARAVLSLVLPGERLERIRAFQLAHDSFFYLRRSTPGLFRWACCFSAGRPVVHVRDMHPSCQDRVRSEGTDVILQ